MTRWTAWATVVLLVLSAAVGLAGGLLGVFGGAGVGVVVSGLLVAATGLGTAGLMAGMLTVAGVLDRRS